MNRVTSINEFFHWPKVRNFFGNPFYIAFLITVIVLLMVLGFMSNIISSSDTDSSTVFNIFLKMFIYIGLTVAGLVFAHNKVLLIEEKEKIGAHEMSEFIGGNSGEIVDRVAVNPMFGEPSPDLNALENELQLGDKITN